MSPLKSFTVSIVIICVLTLKKTWNSGFLGGLQHSLAASWAKKAISLLSTTIHPMWEQLICYHLVTSLLVIVCTIFMYVIYFPDWFGINVTKWLSWQQYGSLWIRKLVYITHWWLVYPVKDSPCIYRFSRNNGWLSHCRFCKFYQFCSPAVVNLCWGIHSLWMWCKVIVISYFPLFLDAQNSWMACHCGDWSCLWLFVHVWADDMDQQGQGANI